MKLRWTLWSNLCFEGATIMSRDNTVNSLSTVNTVATANGKII